MVIVVREGYTYMFTILRAVKYLYEEGIVGVYHMTARML